MMVMKRSFALVLSLGLLAGSCDIMADSYRARQIDDCNEYVNLREDADSRSESLDKVYIGEVVMATPYNDDYSYCCYNGQFGYILDEYLTSNIRPWSEGTFYVTNCDNYISMRKMPMSGADVVARIPRGATLDAIYYHDGGDTSGKYVYVKYDGEYGFVLWDYLAAERPRESSRKSSTMKARQIDGCQYVNLREDPDSGSDSLGKVYVGEVVMASTYDDDYSYCCYNGQFGYILTEYLTSDIHPWSDGTFYVTNCDNYISMRRMPISGADVIARIPRGATLDAIYYHDGGDTSGKYVYVKYEGEYGFVLWDYLASEWHEGGQ
jgi:hypothetical protein